MGEHVRAGRLDIWTERVGDGPDVLLIGGLGDTVESWQFQLEGLAEGCQHTAFDNRGAGRTGCPRGPCRSEAMADDAAGVLRALEIPSAPGRRLLRREHHRPRARAPSPRARPQLGPAEHLAGPGPLPAHAFPHKQSARDVQRFLDALVEHDTSDRLNAIAAPTLVLAGGRDLSCRPELCRAVADRIPGARFEILEGEAHQTFQEVPDQRNARVDASWREVEGHDRLFTLRLAGSAERVDGARACDKGHGTACGSTGVLGAAVTCLRDSPAMPHQNRVTPVGDLIAHAARGLVFGNRGCLHDPQGRIRRHHAGRAWIACRLRFKDRRRALMQPGRYTELFFLDDATALAAGHRPCAECRREDFDAFAELWPGRREARVRAPEMDAQLHAQRLTDDGRRRWHEAVVDEVPDGTFVMRDAAPWLVDGDALRHWTAAGYTAAVSRPTGERVVVVTPPSVVAVLERGWRPSAVPLMHPSANGHDA